MSKLARVFQKIFASTATLGEIGKFGSLAAGSPATTTDAAEAQSLSNWLDGWFSAVIGENSPAIEDLNAVPFVLSRQLAYLFQQGVPEWDATTTYYIGSVVTVGAQSYTSRTDSNLNNTPSTDVTNWRNTDTPAGVMQPFGGGSAPDLYLMCDGSVKNRSDYPHLFSAIGTAFNTGGESGTQFRLPSMARRVPVGAGGSGTGTLGNAVGNVGGEETHTLSNAEIPSHTHPYSGTTGGQSADHTHVYDKWTGHGQNGGADGTYSGGLFGLGNDANSSTSGTSGDHTHNISGTTDADGGGGAHNNIQPSIVVNYIIKT